MDVDATIEERHFTRLAGVARTTRQDWARRHLVAAQVGPYAWCSLADVVAVRELRGQIESADVAVVWKQVRPQVALWSEGEPALVLLDCGLLRALWNPTEKAMLDVLRAGRPVRAIQLAAALSDARSGFEVAAAARQGSESAVDELHPRRARRRSR